MNEHKCALKPVSIGVDVHFSYIKFNFPENKTKGGSLTHAYSWHHTVTGVAHEHAKKIIPRVKKLLTERIDGDNHWNFDIKVDLMIGSAEDVHESVDKAQNSKSNINGIMSFV